MLQYRDQIVEVVVKVIEVKEVIKVIAVAKVIYLTLSKI